MAKCLRLPKERVHSDTESIRSNYNMNVLHRLQLSNQRHLMRKNTFDLNAHFSCSFFILFASFSSFFSRPAHVGDLTIQQFDRTS